LKKVLTFLALAGMLSAQVYYAKVEPLFKYIIAAAVSGQVVLADESLEGKTTDKTIIRLDNALDKVDYEVAGESYKNLKDIYETKRSIYEKIVKMSTKSQIEKDNEKIALLGAKNSMESARLQMESAKDRLAKKRVTGDNLYVYDVSVNEGQYVSPGTKLAELYDVSASRLVIFVTRDEIEGLSDDNIIVDGKAGVYRIDKKWRSADTEFISSYRVELVGPAPEKFSGLAKVEILKTQQEKR